MLRNGGDFLKKCGKWREKLGLGGGIFAASWRFVGLRIALSRKRRVGYNVWRLIGDDVYEVLQWTMTNFT